MPGLVNMHVYMYCTCTLFNLKILNSLLSDLTEKQRAPNFKTKDLYVLSYRVYCTYQGRW
jgi:hypothetical protein